MPYCLQKYFPGPLSPGPLHKLHLQHYCLNLAIWTVDAIISLPDEGNLAQTINIILGLSSVFSSPGAQSEFVIVTVLGGQTLTFGGVFSADLSQLPLHLVDNRHCVRTPLDEGVLDLNTLVPGVLLVYGHTWTTGRQTLMRFIDGSLRATGAQEEVF